MQMRTPDELKKQAEVIGLKYWSPRRCSICNARLMYYFNNECDPIFDSNCDCCRTYPRHEHTWELVAECYNGDKTENANNEKYWKFCDENGNYQTLINYLEMENFLLSSTSNYIELETNFVKIIIYPRQNYCDRGKFVVMPANTQVGLETSGIHHIDEQDMFPRCYFHFLNVMSEMLTWIAKRNLAIMKVHTFEPSYDGSVQEGMPVWVKKTYTLY